MSAATNNAISENDLEEGQLYTIKRRGQFVTDGKFTGRYETGGALGNNPIFEVDGAEKSYARGRYSYYKAVKGGRRQSRRRRQSHRRHASRRH
jgi:hypothetical protein